MSRKILFVCYGDSTSPKAWSNVPYLFSENLKKQGFEIVRLDISPEEKYEKWWSKYPGRVLSRFYRNQQYSFLKTPISRYITNRKIRKAIQENPDLYFAIFLSFDFYNKFNNVPSLILHDWTYDIVILDRLNRKPYFFENWTINFQKEAFRNSEIVISLFKDAQKKIYERHGKPVYHLGSNVVNDINLNKPSREEILARKINSKQLLLIGSSKYLEGARKLVKAFRMLQKEFPELILNFVNLPKERLLLEEMDRNIFCYDYLDKGEPDQNKQYYELLINAKILVNPSEIWAAYSSTIECMFYYTPIIIKPYPAFALDYGEKNDFGAYLQDTEIPTIVSAIRTILMMDEDEYRKVCIRANDLVKDQTWASYTKKVVQLMENVVSNNKS